MTGDRSLNDTVGTDLHQLRATVIFKPLRMAELVALTAWLLRSRLARGAV
jgi:hypothetical protein